MHGSGGALCVLKVDQAGKRRWWRRAGLLRRSLGLHIQRRENDWVVPCLEGVDAPEAGMEVSAATSRELARAEINEAALALVSAGMK